MSQRRFLVLFRNQPSNAPSSGPSPEQMQQMFAGYKAWMEKYKDQIVDLGDKLKADGRVMTASGVSDGPYAEAKEIVAGYMIIAAASYDGAVEVARACPVAQMPGGVLELRELAGAKM